MYCRHHHHHHHQEEEIPLVTDLLLLSGHTNDILCVSWSCNLQLATGSSDNTARIWNVLDGSAIILAHPNKADVITLDWNKVGNMIVTGARDGVARVYLNTGTYDVMVMMTCQVS